ncbi:MAG: hypothetical protein VKK04_25620 [Synechococcales bacterium]|nr:hypothetical protein [Synechococcales bacterium]
MVASIQKTAVIGTESRILPVGYDGGNSSAKLVVDVAEIRVPSLFLPIHSELHDVPASLEGGFVEYISGARTDLAGQRWMSGQPAYSKDPIGHIRIVDDPKGKIRYGLQTFLGGISTMKHQPSWELNVVASIQDAQVMGMELKHALQGSHLVRFNGSSESTEVNINVLAVVEEGVGAMIQARPEITPDGETLLYDFGFGTCIISHFGAKGRLINRTVTPGGVEHLVEAIAKNFDMRKRESKEGDRQLIRQGIERRDFIYGKPQRRASWDFSHIYKAELRPWIESVLHTALKTGSPWSVNCDAIIACGGGSQLPLVAEYLERKDIKPIQNGCWANARGLARFAFMKQRGSK